MVDTLALGASLRVGVRVPPCAPLYINTLMTNKFSLPFEPTRRTGPYRIIKETSIKDKVHYEVQFEMMGVDRGTFWEPVMQEHHPLYKTVMHFDSEEAALMYINNGAKFREIVREGVIINV